ncbi:hypothetical protein UFOVP724_119 [uncultured Caudovirales phage]|uniref:Metallothionein n=1 Tax=uncultured Caudovirales phage TaxID=2100421 RepID=A0A6J5NNE6_9CAUD|nr:hypothetical protein UFOVP724_119 [uncultured Caudovirales phage]
MHNHSCEEEECACTTIFTTCSCCEEKLCDCENCDICESTDSTDSIEEE